MYDIHALLKGFMLEGEVLKSSSFGNGHINDTYKVSFSKKDYILQRINTDVFTDPVSMMQNITSVCEHLYGKLDLDTNMQALQFLQNEEGGYLSRDDKGGVWRCMSFIGETTSYDVVPSPSIAYKGAAAFGWFQAALADFKGPRLTDTIIDFHHTPKRFMSLRAAIDADSVGRVKDVQREIDFMLERESHMTKVVDGLASGSLPERIIHNDTKLNNVLFDATGDEAICVIDLDTVMPGSALYDFGDLVRTSTCAAAEDEPDLDKVFLKKDLFKALVDGYLSKAGTSLTEGELDLLAYSGKLITLEIGVRFLTDHLNGDDYFKIYRKNHNLDRARTQIKLTQSLEEQWEDLENIITESRAQHAGPR